MKLYIWEANGISSAYHDDGTLVVLAGSPAEARAVVRAGCATGHDHDSEFPYGYGCEWDGSNVALDREPDRIVDLDAPAVVAFNGGGYD